MIIFQYDSVYGIANGADNTRYNNYGFESGSRGNPTNPVAAAVNTNLAGPAGLYHPQNGPRYGLGLPPRGSGVDGKMNGLHGPKHKRGDMDRECMLTIRFPQHLLIS